MSDTKVSALDQLLLDIFTTALEGGIGYWSVCSHYHWSTDAAGARLKGTGIIEDHQGFTATIFENHGEEDEKRLVIDRSVVAKGYRLATTTWRDRFTWSSGEKPSLVVGPETDWDFDATDADAIVQLGLFGEVVYG